MDLLRGNIKTLYFKYLSAAFGSALISSIYGIVDMAMVGQYQGPDGTAALAVVAPVWNVIYSIGLLMGIGGSVIFSTKRGSGMSPDREDDYSSSLLRKHPRYSIYRYLCLRVYCFSSHLHTQHRLPT